TMAVPDVLGLGRSEAQAAIQQAGLTGRVMTESESSDCATLQANAGKVWSQSPPAGTQVKPGTTVTIKVDPDPAPCAPQ
ncbi:MAG: PASTA domain-containing protein, partial [Actinomycetota bacterium]